jgi:hypothetical protein
LYGILPHTIYEFPDWEEPGGFFSNRSETLLEHAVIFFINLPFQFIFGSLESLRIVDPIVVIKLHFHYIPRFSGIEVLSATGAAAGHIALPPPDPYKVRLISTMVGNHFGVGTPATGAPGAGQNGPAICLFTFKWPHITLLQGKNTTRAGEDKLLLNRPVMCPFF